MRRKRIFIVQIGKLDGIDYCHFMLTFIYFLKDTYNIGEEKQFYDLGQNFLLETVYEI